MMNEESNRLPQVNKPLDISLTDLETSLIQNVHCGYAKVILEKEFGGGFSGTRVFLALPVRTSDGAADARVATKIGPADELRHEKENSQRINRVIPFSATQVREYYEQDGWAALNYVFAGGESLGKTVSLEEFYDTQPTDHVIKSLKGLLGTALGPKLYEKSSPLTCPFRDEYGRHLPAPERLKEIVMAIFPNVARIDGEKIELHNIGTFDNPLKLYPDVLNKTLEGRRSLVHGDLHLRNVLIDESGKGWLIDFAKVQERHNLFDFIKLEVYIRLMALAKQHGAFTLGEYAQFEQALNVAALGQNANIPSNSKLKFAYQVILSIREIAANYLADRNGFKEECLSALFLYTLAMLKYYPSNGDVPTRLIFITTCVCAQELLKETVMSEKTVKTKSLKKARSEKFSGSRQVNTGGGAHVGGNVAIQNGDFVGRDKVDKSITVGNIENATGIAIGSNARVNITQTTNATPDKVAAAFIMLLEKVRAMSDSPAKTIAETAVQGLKTEAGKGKRAEEKNVDDWLSSLAKIAPDIWEVAVDTFINPIKGLNTVFQKVAERAKKESQNDQ